MQFYIFGAISFLLFAASATVCLWLHGRRKKAIISALSGGSELPRHVVKLTAAFTVCVFIATVFMFFPVCYVAADKTPLAESLYRVWASVLDGCRYAMKVFILDCDFEPIVNSVTRDSEWFYTAYLAYATLLYMLSPVLTFTAVLSLFKNFTGAVRLAVHRFRPLCVMSELSERSLAMAESIRKDFYVHKRGGRRPYIVFTDVFSKNEEDNYELITRARNLGAILLKKDISQIKYNYRGEVEIFLIREDESENLNQAARINEQIYSFNKKPLKNISIYVYGVSEGSARFVDSLDKKKEHTLKSEYIELDQAKAYALLFDEGRSLSDSIDGAVRIRRINNAELMVRDILCRPELTKYMYDRADKYGRRVSVAIVGMGSYGQAMLETAVWFYQRVGYTVELNVFALDEDIKEKFLHKHPGFEENGKGEICGDGDGDAAFSIKFFGGIDSFTSSFDNILENEELERIKRTSLVLVALGDDDKSIDAAISVRRIFDRIHIAEFNEYAADFGEKKRKDELKLLTDRGKADEKGDPDEAPIILSVVFDDKRAMSFTKARTSDSKKEKGIFKNNALRDYKGDSYHISFVGMLSKQYTYQVIERLRRDEKNAFDYHFGWVRLEARLRKIWENESSRLRVEAAKSGFDGENPPEWGDSYMFGEGEQKDKNGKMYIAPVFDGDHFHAWALEKMLSDYTKYEYYRNSSIAKYLHKESTAVFFPYGATHSEDNKDICLCDACMSRRLTEHMRWNAYVRANGFKYSESRYDRARLHDKLRPWDELTIFDHLKDD